MSSPIRIAAGSAHHRAAPAGDETSRAPRWRRTLHWSSAGILVIGVGAILLRGIVEGRDLRDGLLLLHRSCGLAVLLLTMARVAAMPWMRSLAVEAGTLARIGARLLHLTLYGLLLALPLVGWALSSARGQPVAFLGVVPLPSLLARSRDLAETLHDVHEGMAIGLFLLVCGHVAAALVHHFVLRDAVLRGMLPARRPAAPACPSCLRS